MDDMEIVFEKEYLSEMYYTGKSSDKKHRFQPQVVRKYQRCIDLLEGATSIETLYQ
jgi:proteic killer suppression protein